MKMNCPHCGVTGTAPERLRGRRVQCPKCQGIFEAGKGGENELLDREKEHVASQKDLLGEAIHDIEELEEHELDRLLAGGADGSSPEAPGVSGSLGQLDSVSSMFGRNDLRVDRDSVLDAITESELEELAPEEIDLEEIDPEDIDDTLVALAEIETEDEHEQDCVITEPLGKRSLEDELLGLLDDEEVSLAEEKTEGEILPSGSAVGDDPLADHGKLFASEEDVSVKNVRPDAASQEDANFDEVFSFEKREADFPSPPLHEEKELEAEKGEDLNGQVFGSEDEYDAYRNRVDALWDEENKRLMEEGGNSDSVTSDAVTCIACGAVIQPGEGYTLGRNVYCVNCVPRRRRVASDSKPEDEHISPENGDEVAERNSLFGKMFGVFSKKSSI